MRTLSETEKIISIIRLMEQGIPKHEFDTGIAKQDVFKPENYFSQSQKNTQQYGFEESQRLSSTIYKSKDKPQPPVGKTTDIGRDGRPTSEGVVYELPYPSERQKKENFLTWDLSNKNKYCYYQGDKPFCKGNRGKLILDDIYSLDLNDWEKLNDLTDPHNVLMAASILSLFVPLVGPALSLGFDLVDSWLYFKEGDKYMGGLMLAFTLIPISRIPGLRKIGKSAAEKLLKKLKVNPMDPTLYTKEELEALRELFENTGVVQKLLDKELCQIMIKKTLTKIGPRNFLAAIYKASRKNPTMFNISKFVLEVGGIWYTYDKLAKIYGWGTDEKGNKLKPNQSEINKIESTVTEEDFIKSMTKFEPDSVKQRELLLKIAKAAAENSSGDIQENNNIQKKNIIMKEDNLIERQKLLMGYNPKHTLSENKLILEANIRVELVNLLKKIGTFGDEALVGVEKREAKDIIQKAKLGRAITELEFEKVIKNINPKKIAQIFLDESTVVTRGNLDVFTDTLVQSASKNRKKAYDIYLGGRKGIGDLFDQGIQPINGSIEWAKGIKESYLDLWSSEFKKKLGEKNTKLLQDFVHQESKIISKLEKEEILNIKNWDGTLWEIPQEQLNLILRNADKSMAENAKNFFYNTSYDFDRIAKLVKSYVVETKNPILQEKIANQIMTNLESVLSRCKRDVEYYTSFLNKLKDSSVVTAEEKTQLTKLIEEINSRSPLLKKWGTTTSIFVEKSAVRKLLSMFYDGIMDSFDGVIAFTWGRADPGFATYMLDGKGVASKFSWNVAKTIKEKVGVDVLGSGEKFANMIKTGSQRGFPKLENAGAQEIFEKYGSVKYLYGVYITTLVAKVVKGAAVIAVLKTMSEWIAYSMYEPKVKSCYLAIKKLKEEGATQVDETNIPKDCMQDGIIEAMAFNFATQEQKLNPNEKFWGEFTEKFLGDIKNPLSIFYINPVTELIVHVSKTIYELNKLTRFDSPDKIRETINATIESIKKAKEQAESDLISAGNKLEQGVDSAAAEWKAKIDTLAQDPIFNQAEQDSIKKMEQDAQDKVTDVVTDAVTTLTAESFKQQYTCYWDNGYVDTNKGTNGTIVINDNSVIIYFSGKDGYKGIWTLSKTGEDWYYVQDGKTTETKFGKCE